MKVCQKCIDEIDHLVDFVNTRFEAEYDSKKNRMLSTIPASECEFWAHQQLNEELKSHMKFITQNLEGVEPNT